MKSVSTIALWVDLESTETSSEAIRMYYPKSRDPSSRAELVDRVSCKPSGPQPPLLTALVFFCVGGLGCLFRVEGV